MNFADEAEKESRGGYLGRGCGVGAMLARLDQTLREEVTDVLMNRPDITGTAIRRALIKASNAGEAVGAIPSAYTIQRHRKEMCSCGSA